MLSMLVATLALAPTPQETGPPPIEGTSPKRTELPDEPVVVPLDLSRGWPVIEVMMGDHGPYRMILDTGSSVTVLNARLLAEQGIEPAGKTRVGDPSNPTAVEVDLAPVPRLQIADALFEEFTAIAWSDDMGMSGMGLDGIVGMPTFRDCLLTLDYGAGEARIQRGELPAADGVRVLEFEGNGTIDVRLEVAGETVLAHFDSGNAGSIKLPGTMEARLPLVAGSEVTRSGRRASGPVEMRGGILDGTVRVGSLAMERPEVMFDDSLVAGNIGRSFLDQGPVTIDLKNGRLRLGTVDSVAQNPRTPSGARVRDLSRGGRRLGIQLTPGAGPELRISQVMSGSLAERSGLKAGDVLLTVDGKSVSSSDHEPLREALSRPDAFPIQVQRGDEKLEIRIPGA